MANNPPGVMIYYDIMPAIDYIDLEDCGRLFRAILDYGRDGIVPDFGGTLAAIWSLIMPRIDRDRNSYIDKVMRAKYAVYRRETKRNNDAPLSYDQWLISHDID